MDKLVLKYNASRVDEIEKAKGLPIENCIADNTINNLALFLQKGLVDGNGNVGVSRSVAISTIDKYLESNDKDELLFDITEALVDSGFLSRTLDVNQMRQLKETRTAKMMEEMRNMS